MTKARWLLIYLIATYTTVCIAETTTPDASTQDLNSTLESSTMSGTTSNETNSSSNETSTNTTEQRPREKTFVDYPEFTVMKAIEDSYNYFTNVPGIVGNFFTILTAAKMKPYTSTSICILLLATTDFGMCVMRFSYVYIPGYSKGYCKSVIFFYAFFSIMSNFILVCWTVERLIAVAFPMKLQLWCTVRNTKIALAVAFLCAFLLSMTYLIEADSQTIHIDGETITRCTYSDFIIDYYGYIDATFYVWLPLLVILISNAAIVIIMSKRRKAHASMTTNTEQQDKRSAEQRRMTYILLSVSVAFMVFHIPYVVKTAYDIYFYLDPLMYGHHFYAKYILMGLIVTVWLQLQNTVNFVVYCLTGPRFRKEFLNLVCFCRKQPGKTDRVSGKESTAATNVSVTTASKMA